LGERKGLAVTDIRHSLTLLDPLTHTPPLMHTLCSLKGKSLYDKWTTQTSMFTRIPGWNVNEKGERDNTIVARDAHDWSLLDLVEKKMKKNKDPLTGLGEGA